MASSDRLLGLIDSAYEVADSPERFDTFLEAVRRYLFNEEVNGRIATDVPHNPTSDPLIDSHTDRILKAVSRAFAQASASDGRNHAILYISPNGSHVSGNLAAQVLMNLDFPCALEDLPLDRETKRAVLRSNTDGLTDHQAEEIHLTTIGTSEPKPCLALIRHHAQRGDDTEVSISHIDWSPHLIFQIGRAFGLTNSETDILEGYLRKFSQKEIASRRNRSLQTVKAQSKTILRKTGCSRMSDVVQLSAGIAYLLRQLPKEDLPPINTDWKTPKEGMHRIKRSDGRRISWYQIGSGTDPVLFIHGLVQGPFFTPELIREITRAGYYFICPSRPGFGFSDPSKSRASYNETSLDDANRVLEHLGVASCAVLGHQGGTSHAFRIANALGERCKGLLIVDGGVPLNETDDFDSIEPNSRLLAAAAKRSPSMLKMVARISKIVYRKRGIEPFLGKTYGASEVDMAALQDPDIFSVVCAGVYHVTEQSSEIWVRDGASAMHDWSSDFTCDTPNQIWLQARHAKTLGVDVVERRLKDLPCAQLTIVPDAGNTLLYTHPHTVITALEEIAVHNSQG